MCRKSLGLIIVCLLASGCAQLCGQVRGGPDPAEVATVASLNTSFLPEFRDYCWSEQHFAKVDFERAAFIQFVNADMVIYRRSEGKGKGKGKEMLHCAFPVDNELYKARAKAKGIPYSEFVSVKP